MKQNYKKIIFLSLIIVMICSVSTTIYAAEGDYTVLAPLPGIGETDDGKTNLQTYLPAVFSLAIGIAAAMAFVMITLGGVTYATSDAVFQKSQGKEWITNAIWGLVLVIGAWVILNTINPQILKFDLSLERPKIEYPTPTAIPGVPRIGGGGVRSGYVMTPAQIADDARVRSGLSPLTINRTSPCQNGETTGCTNLNDLPPQVIPTLKYLQGKCSCAIEITGGTEGGHVQHGPGQPVVDLADNAGLRKYIEDNSKGQPPGNIKIVRLNTGGGMIVDGGFKYEADGEGRSTGAHWHVILGK